MRPFSTFAILLVSGVVFLGQTPPAGVAARTPAPGRDGAAPISADRGGAPQASPKKGGNFELDPDDDDEDQPEDSTEGLPASSPSRGRFSLGDQGVQEGQIGQELMSSPGAVAARAAEAKRLAALRAQGSDVAGVQSALDANRAIAKEIQSLQKQMNRQTEAQAGINRDAVRSDAVADVEFAEAMASRRASSIARTKGLALIPAMSTIEMRLLTYASSEQGGKFKALIISDVWDASFASIGLPSGTLARGFIEAAANDGDSRIRMTVTEFQLPSGDSVQLRIPDAVTDPIGATGPKGDVNHKWGTRLGYTGLYVVAGTLSSVGTQSPYSQGAGFNDILRQNLSGQMGQQAQSSFQSGMQIKPTVDLREGSFINMILGSNLYLVPWERFRPVIPAPNQTSAH